MSEVVEIDGDTIYVIDQTNAGPLAPTQLYSKIDWLQLAKQKDYLLNLIAHEHGHAFDDAPAHPLDGLVDLLDFMQDEAEQRGYRVVYGYNRQEWEEDNGNEDQTQH